MAAALLHEPEILFLDEPTSGADPLARREFWRRITALAEQGVTVIVTTHFMEEAEYCDRVAILDAGRMLAQGTPAEVRQRGSRAEARRADDGGRLHRHRRGGARQARQVARMTRAAWPESVSQAPGRASCGGIARAGAQGELSDAARPEQHRDRRRACRCMLILLFGYGAVARREERAGRGRPGGTLARRDGARRRLRALALFRRRD